MANHMQYRSDGGGRDTYVIWNNGGNIRDSGGNPGNYRNTFHNGYLLSEKGVQHKPDRPPDKPAKYDKYPRFMSVMKTDYAWPTGAVPTVRRSSLHALEVVYPGTLMFQYDRKMQDEFKRMHAQNNMSANANNNNQNNNHDNSNDNNSAVGQVAGEQSNAGAKLESSAGAEAGSHTERGRKRDWVTKGQDRYGSNSVFAQSLKLPLSSLASVYVEDNDDAADQQQQQQQRGSLSDRTGYRGFVRPHAGARSFSKTVTSTAKIAASRAPPRPAEILSTSRYEDICLSPRTVRATQRSNGQAHAPQSNSLSQSLSPFIQQPI